MRTSNQSAWRRRRPSGAVAVIVSAVTALVVACGGTAAPSAPPSVAPTPVITPDPHLKEPVTADQGYAILQSAKLGMSCPNAVLGDPGQPFIKQINCTLAGWPLRITQYASSGVLQKTVGWKAGAAPGGDEPPYAIAGLNVLITYGPTSAQAPSAPDSQHQTVAAQIVALLDPLLWPLSQHSVVQVPSRTPEPTPTPSVSVAPTKPAKTPKPSHKP
jgi:hypothetical protein